MNSSSSFSRRDALKTVAMSALALPILGSALRAADPSALPAKSKRHAQMIPKLGLATYSLAKLTVDEVIAVMTRLELKGASVYRTHAPWTEGTPDQCKAVVAKFKAAGIAVTSTGMIDLPNDEAALRKSFTNVKSAGLNSFCGWLKATDSLPLVDKLVKEYDLRIAIHNHGPTEALATGMDVWKAVQPFDPRIGLCLDLGHGFRAGENAVETIHIARERLYQVHLRDTAANNGTMKDPHPVVIGHGLLNFPRIIAALQEIRFSDWADFEYEKKEEDRIPGLAESVGYVRGIIAATAKA
jgi:inosose dehydratase